MVNLPGSVLWFLLFVHLIRGQLLDNFSPGDKATSDFDDAKNAINGTKAQENDDEGRSEELEKTEEEERLKPPDGVYLSEGLRKRTGSRKNAATVADFPQMSPERRKSYLSIAERRKYYNRTRSIVKTTQRDVLLYQETTNRPNVANERLLLMNEIRESKQKDLNKVVTEGRNDTENQRIVVEQSKNETLPKTDNVSNQTVIYPHVEFGQKLLLRKPAARVQDLRNDKQRRRKEKSKEELSVINSTNKLSKNIQTQSTKLVKVDGSLWSTTRNPIEADNFVMPWKKNKTSAEKVAKYVKTGAYVDGNTAEIEKVLPVPLSVDEANAVAPTDITTTEVYNATESVEETVTIDTPPTDVRNVTEASAVATTSTTTATTTTTMTTTTTTPPPPITTTTPPTTTSTTPSTTVTSSTTASTSTTTTTLRPPYRKSYVPSVDYKSRYNYTRRPSFKPTITTEKSKTNATYTPIASRIRPISSLNEVRKWKPSSTTTTTVKEPPRVTEEYPLTIEINENNKRLLSEMFQTTSESLPVTTKATSRPPTTANASVSNSTTEENTIDHDDFGEDHKSVGTSFNTKFYIIPNVTKTEVIKIVEDDDAENEVLVTAQTVGIAIYILAAFGLIPLLLALVFGAKFFVQRHRRKDDCDSDLRSDISGNDNHLRHGKGGSELKKSPSNVTTTTLVATTRLPRVHHWENYEKNVVKNWEFPRSKLKMLTILGQGNFGQVWKAEAEDMQGHEGLTRLVAVKTVKEGATEKEHAELIKELEIMQQIGSHSNIVTLLGCCTDQEPYYLIMEYVMYGKLLTYLREHRTNENYYNISSNNDALTSRDLTVFAYCVARGMEYLASKGIIHRDLAARNVLVDHNKLCKIADFGMSRSVRDTEDGQLYEERQHKGALPIRWMAPESLTYSLFTHKSDVWSFGIVLWEIVTLGSTPYPNMGAREVMRKVREGYRLERPPHCKHELYQLISRCWAHDPNKRPDFGELRRELTNLLDDTSKDGIYVDLDSFAVTNRFHITNNNNNSKTNDFRLLERNEFKTLRRLEHWEGQDWPMESRKTRSKKSRNNGKGTVTLTGQGSFTVNSRILEKEFKLV